MEVNGDIKNMLFGRELLGYIKTLRRDEKSDCRVLVCPVGSGLINDYLLRDNII